MNNSHRLEKLRQMMSNQNLDAVALIPGANLRYLTNAQILLTERPFILFIPQNGEAVGIVPALDEETFVRHGFPAEILPWADSEGPHGALAQATTKLGLDGKRVGVEGQLIRYFEALAIQQHLPNTNLVDAHGAISSIRYAKDATEIAALQKAVDIAEQALQYVIAQVRVGMNEMQIAHMLSNKMKELGGQGEPFQPLVLAADNSARPHGHPRSDYAIQRGDALLIDFGTTVDGYFSDITRTFFVGEVSDAARSIYEVVLNANEVGRAAVRPGIPVHDVDQQATDALINAGYQHLVLHRTGHGLGLEVHEDPSVVMGNDQQLEPGVVITIEPGLYEAGHVGVRIEDNVVVTEDGMRSLTSFPRDLTIIGGES